MSALNIDSTDALALLINAHKRLAQEFPKTNYCIWCNSVHTSKTLTPQEKFDRILSWKINPDEYVSPTLFASDWQLFKFLSKVQLTDKIPESYIRLAEAKFTDAESRCQQVNGFYSQRVLPRGVSQLLEDVKRYVSYVLGDISEFFQFVESLASSDPTVTRLRDQFDRYGRQYDVTFDGNPQFGPGVSVSAEGSSLSSLGEKLLCGTVTARCAYIGNWLSRLWHLPHCRVVTGSVLTYVPKKVGEARAICYEPSMNMLVQKLIGRYIKRRLKTVCGIDLRDQSRNQALARLGSLCDSYATADQTSASDLFAYQFVMQSLPFDWFSFLDDARSPSYKNLDGEWNFFEKFSTMGNGFTFELETLLFAAIVKHACDWSSSVSFNVKIWDYLSVYGDDIIFPKDHFLAVQQALLISGHIPNLQKSFAFGPFRESCGGDFFKGWNVTPFKVMKLKDMNDVKSVVNMVNGMASRHLDNPHRVSLYGWLGRYFAFLQNRLFNDHAKLSHGPIEKRFLNDGSFSYEPSNRWIWDLDGERRNNAYCPRTQQIIPKWLLIEKEYTADFHVPSEAAKYICSMGRVKYVVSSKLSFVRNPLFRDMRANSNVIIEGKLSQQARSFVE